MTRVPRHIAIIMDGNGRWAKARGRERTYGHQEGVERVKEIMTAAVNLGVEYLTLYTFSTENWNRPADEVAALMALLMKHLEEELFVKNNARFRVIGDKSRLPQGVQGPGRPMLVLPSPPPCGWSLGFMTEPRTVGLIPM